MINHSRSQLIRFANQTHCVYLKKAMWQYQYQHKTWEDALHDCVIELAEQNDQLVKTADEMIQLIQKMIKDKRIK